MAHFLTDLRYGIRMLFRTPTLSVVSILTIALGVGLTTHTFSVVYGSVMRGLPVPAADRFVAVKQTILERGVDQSSMPMHDYVELRDQTTSFEDLGAARDGTVNVAGNEGPPERFEGAFVSANALAIVGVQPFLGRTFREGEDLPGAPGTVVLGYDVWRTRFAADEAAIGGTVRANGETMTIIGVMPPDFRFPFDHEIWLADRQDWRAGARRDPWFVEVFGRLREGVPMEAAIEEVQAVSARLEAEFPVDNEGVSATVMPFEDGYMPPEITAVLWLMLAAVFGVMLVACANVANLLLARAALRARDVAVRTALGANRGRIVGQLLAETIVLGLIGGAIGFVASYAGVVIFNSAIADIQKPYWIDIRIDGTALMFTILTTLVAAVAAGTIPALRASAGGIADTLRDDSRGSSSLRIGRVSGALVVAELALSCALLIAAGFMVRSVINAQQLELGFEPANLMTARVGLFETDYPTRDERQRFFRNLYERLNDQPGVRAATLTTSLPSSGSGRQPFAIEGRAYETDADYPLVNTSVISSRFFEAMGTEMLAGREFRDSESFSSSGASDATESLVIVNRSFVDRFLAGEDPLGKRVRLGRGESENPWMRIVGVVPDLYVGGGVGGIGNDQVPPQALYTSIAAGDHRFLSLAIRTAGPPGPAAQQARRVVSAIDRNLPLYFVMPMTQVVADNSWAFSIFGSLFSIFGGTALFLAAVGLYGVMSFSVAQRRQEMGVRMALGARSSDILRIIFGRVGLQLAIGLSIGVGLGYALSRPLRAVMFGVETSDLTVYLAIVATLIGAALLATFFPAHRATRIDPITALRPD